MVNVLALPGSLRRHSHNRRLLEAAAAVAPSDVAVTVTGIDGIPLFNEDLENGSPPEAVERLGAAVAGADGLLIATPEYNQSIPGLLKNTIDWLSRAPDKVLAGKAVAVMGATAGPWGTRLAQAALRQVLAATEARVMPAPALYIRDAAGLFDGDGPLVDEKTRTRLGALMEAFAKWMEGDLRPAALSRRSLAPPTSSSSRQTAAGSLLPAPPHFWQLIAFR